MRVTLTFDNGPDPVGTPAVLDALSDRGIPAVFFVVGAKVKKHPDLVSRISAAGHTLGNHTWSHSSPLGDVTEPGVARAEIDRTQDVIEESRTARRLFRPVGGDPGAVIDHRLLNDEAMKTLTDGGYTMALWNVVPRDWELPDSWLEGAIDACRAVDHAVVVLHDGHPAGMALLPTFLDALGEENAEFRTDFPSSCTPVVKGVPRPESAALVTADPHPYLHSSTMKEQP
ncbi:polysaccharide deacetylase family protein [Microbacterium sp.]|uniref:polysaccharide deacetylase family protein n=1 Tax=Microbacterium sp. TaxID=51671 RepID=UPI0035641AC8